MVALSTISGYDHPMASSVSHAPASKPDTRQLDELELAAWRGMLFAYRNMTAAIDARLESQH